MAVNTHSLILDTDAVHVRAGVEKPLTKIRQIVFSRRMHLQLLLLFSLGLYSSLNCILSTSGVTWQSFKLSLAGNNQCPSQLSSFQGLTATSRVQCAVECSFSPQCIDFSYYASSGKCYLYSSLPSKVSYNNDCNFMMVSYTYFLHEIAQMRCKKSVKT